MKIVEGFTYFIARKGLRMKKITPTIIKSKKENSPPSYLAIASGSVSRYRAAAIYTDIAYVDDNIANSTALLEKSNLIFSQSITYSLPK